MRSNESEIAAMFKDAADLFEIGRIGDSLERIDSILKRSRCHHGAWYYRGRCFERMGRVRKALRCYRRATGISPDYAAAHCEIGFCLNVLGRHRSALAHLARALSLDPTMDAAIINSGYAYERLGRFDKACEAYLYLVSRSPLNANGWQNLALRSSLATPMPGLLPGCV
jgi:tetratricopeptide (TPR) repeat protein